MLAREERTLLAILLACGLSGCSATTQFTLPEDQLALAAEVAVGDEIQLLTTTGESRDLTVTDLSEAAVCGPDRCYSFTEIREIALEKFSFVKTGALTIGTVLTLTVAAAAAVGSVL